MNSLTHYLDGAVIEFHAGGETVDTAESRSVNEITEYLEG